ncbi:Uric acid degradation bifunctional protein TTL-like protein [Drosera capensis]
MGSVRFDEKDYLACCGSSKFAKKMAALSPFSSLDVAIIAARDIWFNKVDVTDWLEAFTAHPAIGVQIMWSTGEQSTALATANSNTLQRRFSNRSIDEFEIAAQEQMKITEIRLSKLFPDKANTAAPSYQHQATAAEKLERSGLSFGPCCLRKDLVSPNTNPSTCDYPCPGHWTRPSSLRHQHELRDMEGPTTLPIFCSWVLLGSGTTDKDGRSGQLMSTMDAASPGVFRISFDTGRYCPEGFFPLVSIFFEIKESQKFEHFHVPLLLSPFSFSTYRGSWRP